MGEFLVGRTRRDPLVVQALATPCNCCQESINWAMEKMWPDQREPVRVVPLVYTVHVSVVEFSYTRLVIKEMNGPLPPQVNLVIDYELERDMWYVTDGMGRAVGSTGC